MNRRAVVVIAVLLAGCPNPPSPPVPDAAAPIDAGVEADAGPPVIVDAGPPAPTELTFAIDFLGLDGGVSTVRSTEGHAEIDPARTVLIQFPAALKDFRVRMFDGAEQVLPSDEEARVEDGGMSYRIALAAPLKAGRAYNFSVESELGHEITDIAGHGYRDVFVSLTVRGEPEPAGKPGKKRRKVR